MMVSSQSMRGLALSFLLHLGVVALAGQSTQPCHAEASAAEAKCRSKQGDRGSALVQLNRRIHSALQSRASAGVADAGRAASAGVSAVHIRSHLAVPENLGTALATGLLAVQTALPFFVKEPPQISEGFQHLGSKLFDAVVLTLPTNVTESSEFMEFSEAWEESVVSLPTIVGSLQEHIQAYKEEGDVTALLGIFRTSVIELGTVVTQFLPEDVGAEVAKFLGAVEDALEGFDTALEAFAVGNTTQAIQSMYSGLRLASNELVPPELQNDKTYKLVVGAVDGVFKDLSKSVLMYQQRLLQAKVCWKDFVQRESIRPDKCPQNHFWNGEAWCLGVREGSSSPVQIKNRHGICLDAAHRGWRGGSVTMWNCDSKNPNQQWLYKAATGQIKNLQGLCLDASERSTTGGAVVMWTCVDGNKNQEWEYTNTTGQIKNRHGICLDAEHFSTPDGKVQMYPCDESAKNQQWDMLEPLDPAMLEISVSRKRPSNAVPAQCDPNSDFNEQRGTWCYKSCPFGSEASGSFCKSACIGDYPVQSPLMCGRSPGTIAAAIQELATRTLKAGLNVAGLSSTVGTAAGLQGTITELVEFGSGFAFPKCPMLSGQGASSPEA